MSRTIRYLLLVTAFLTLSFGIEVEPEVIKDQSKLESANKHKVYFGEQLFKGHFTNKSQFRENPEYLLKVGDIIHINIWGAREFQGDVPIDGRGNIFIPKIGVIHLEGVKNGNLQSTLTTHLEKTFNDNVFIYANVRDYQQLSVYVSGSVKNVGLYDGVSNDSVLQFLDKAGGIVSGEGSYRNIHILRNNRLVKKIDLYAFLLDGYRESFPFRDGDTILVQPMKHYVEVEGDVSRPYIFELKEKNDTVNRLMKYTLPKPGVNRFTHIKRLGMREVSQDYTLDQAGEVKVKSGEKIIFTSNSHLQSFSIAIEGEHSGVKHISVPKGTSLYSLLKQVNYTPLSHIQSIQLYRESVAQRQKELLETNLKDLEAKVFTSGSSTPEEALIRNKEAELVMEFIKRAKQVEFKGQIILSAQEDLRNTLLEDGDRIYIPRKSNLVTVQGEVNIPNTLTYKSGESLRYYIDACGGYTERADSSEVLLIRSNGKVEKYSGAAVQPGDSILVLGKTDTKNLLLAKDLTQIIYQVAVGAAVVLKSF
ncbi:MAG: SLBB domain-containing protein [Sulfurovum sp.]|nr:SLBB domain-containing protein [Sulfurovum sp.]